MRYVPPNPFENYGPKNTCGKFNCPGHMMPSQTCGPHNTCGKFDCPGHILLG